MTPEQTTAVLDAIRSGLTMTGAAQAAGIDRSAILSRMKSDPDFDDAVEAAEELALDACEDTIARAAQTDWCAALAMLQARRSDRWGPTSAPDLSQEAAKAEVDAIIDRAGKH